MNLKRLFGICEHKWRIIDKTAIFNSKEIKNFERPIGSVITLKCEKCGRIKFERLDI